MRPSRIPLLARVILAWSALPFAWLVLTAPTAVAGDHHKKVVVGYVPATPTYGYAYPVAAAPAAAAAPAVGYYYPVAAGAAAPAAAAPAAAAPAPAATSYYNYYAPGYYYGSAQGSGAAAAPAAAAPGVIPAAISGAKVTDQTTRKEIVDRLSAINSSFIAANLADRGDRLKDTALSVYAGKAGVDKEDLNDTDKKDVDALIAAATGNATGSTSSSGNSSQASAVPGFYVMPAPAVPMVPVYAQPVHHWIYQHPWLYNRLVR